MQIITRIAFFCILVIQNEAFPKYGKNEPSSPNSLNSKDTKVRPKCAGGKTYCIESESYPTELVNNLIKQGVLSNSGFEDPTPEFDLSNRFFNNIGDKKICDFDEIKIKPVKAVTAEGKWLDIINVDNYTQRIRVEECMVKNARCSILFHNSEARCEQKYIYRPLMALDDGKPVQAYFKFPSCCVCYIHNPRLIKKNRSQQLKRETPKFDNALTVVDPDEIVFPQTSVGESLKTPFTITNRPCEGSSDFCIQARHYPKEYIKSLLDTEAFENLFITKIDVPPTLKTENRHSAGHTNHSPLCDSELKTIRPEAIKTPTNSWEYIAQSEDGTDKIIQAFQIEQCTAPGSQCYFANQFPLGYTTVCRQKNALKPVVTIDGITGTPHTSFANIPSCCVCDVTLISSLNSRFGTAEAPKTPAMKNRRKTYI